MIFESIETALKADTVLFAAIHLGVVTICLTLFLYLTRSRKNSVRASKDEKTFTDDLEGMPHFRPAKVSTDRPSAPENESGITPPSKPPAPPPPGIHLQRPAPIRLEVIHEPSTTTGESTTEAIEAPAVESSISPKDNSAPEESGNGTIQFPEGMPPVVSTGSDPVAHRTKEEVAIRIYQLFQGNESETLIAIDREEHILALNPGAEKLFQYLSHELRGKKIEDIIFLEAGDKDAAKGSGTDLFEEEDKQRAKGHAKDGSSFPVGVELEMADRPLGIILVRIHTLDLLVKPGKPVFEDLPSEEPEQKKDILSTVGAIAATAVVLHPIMGNSKPSDETVDPSSEPIAEPKPEDEETEAANKAAVVDLEPVVDTEVPQETPAPLDATANEADEDKPVPEVEAAIEEPSGEDDSSTTEPTEDKEPDVTETTENEEAVSADPAILPVEETRGEPEPQAEAAPAQEVSDDVPPPSDTQAEEADLDQPKKAPEEPAATEAEPPSISEDTTPEPEAIPESKPEDEETEAAVEAAVVDLEPVVETEVPQETPAPLDATANEADEDKFVPEVEAAIEEPSGEDDSSISEPTEDKEPDVTETTVIEEAVSADPAIQPVEETGGEPEPQAEAAPAQEVSDDVPPPSDTQTEAADLDQPKEAPEEPAATEAEPPSISEDTTPEPEAIPESKGEDEETEAAIEAAVVDLEPVVETEVPQETPAPLDATANEADEDKPIPEVEAAIEEPSGEDDSSTTEPTEDKEPDVTETTVIEEAVSADPAILPVEETGGEPEPQTEAAPAQEVSDDVPPPSDTQTEAAGLDQPKEAPEEPAATEAEPPSISEDTTPEPEAIPESKGEDEETEAAVEAAVVDLEPVVETEVPQETPAPLDATANEADEDKPVPEVEAAIEEPSGEDDSSTTEPTEDKEPDVTETTVIEEAVSADPAILPVEETRGEPEPQTEAAPAQEVSDDVPPPSDTQTEAAGLDQPKEAFEEPAAPEAEPASISEDTTPEPDAIPESKPEDEETEAAVEAAVVDLEPVVETEVPQETPAPEMPRESSQTPESMPSLGEIEQPLHSISRIAKLMAVEQPDTQRIKEYAEAIEERSNRMAEQIEELKAMLRQTRALGASSSKMSPIDISRLADILANEASSLVSSSDKRVQCNILDADSLYGLGNESGLTQVINSLIDLGLHCIDSGCVHIDVRSDATEPLVNASESYSLNGKTLVPDSKREVIIQTRFQTSPAIRQYLESAFGPNPDFDAIEDDPSIAILAGIASRIRLSVRAMNGRFVFETPVVDEVMVQTQWDMQCLREEI